MLNTAATFQLVNVSAAWGDSRPAPLTVHNTFGVNYYSGERTIALEQVDGTWTNLPDPHRAYASAGDTFAETLFYKLWAHGSFNPTSHQPVYFEEFSADIGVHGPPVPRTLVRAFTAKGTGGGGGDYDAGCGIDADLFSTSTIQVLVDPYGCLVCDPETGLKVKVDPNGCLSCGAEPQSISARHVYIALPQSRWHKEEEGLRMWPARKKPSTNGDTTYLACFVALNPCRRRHLCKSRVHSNR